MGAPPVMAEERVEAYLAAIGLDEHPDASADWLQRLHVAHLQHVPFENLDIHRGEPIRFELPALFDKLVVRRRGGYCYELNGLFASLLAAAGHDVTLVSSRVWMPGGELSPPFDHLALLVELEGDVWLVDVGFGDAFRRPRPLGSEWSEPGRALRTLETAEGWRLEKDEGAGWTPMYLLDLTPRDLPEFQPRSRWHERSPDSPFQRRPLVTRATRTGRVTITEDRLIVTDRGERTEHELVDAESRRAAARAWFPPSVVEALEEAVA